MFSVAIDGPAGAGKSTIAKAAAKELELIYVDTGAMYRTIGLACLDDGISPEDSKAVIEKLKSIVLELKYVDGEQRMILCGKDVSDDIRTERVSMTASVVSKIPEVRAFLLEQQRGFARSDNIIMDGRDIGTVVLPDAQVKIFLTASAESRAKRRTLQLEEKGIGADYDAILEDIRKRDYQDSHREIAPLKAAPDAVIVDTTELTLEGSIEAVIDTIRKGMSGK
ncbi:MAG: (d)CMP kinase [Schwartzia sp.]|nr:(d)CMP kinase [Schwartzia sp. (in: firmicutes)]